MTTSPGDATVVLSRTTTRCSVRHPAAMKLPATLAFLALLFLTGLTGLALLAFRETRAMGVLLAVHLATVLALFVTMPYGKFVHAMYRLAALARFHVERRRPMPEVAAE